MTWAVKEMENRYKEMEKHRVKKIQEYNELVAKGVIKVEVADEDNNLQRHDGGKMPYVVILIDEMADLMMVARKELESLVVRIAQMGRAAGIHLVLATQSPRKDVVTGLIKGNVPSTIAFQVKNYTESIISLGESGAEKLLGQGDMLMIDNSSEDKEPRRIQGAFATTEDVNRVTDYIRDQASPEYNDDVANQKVSIKGSLGTATGGAAQGGDVSEPILRDIMIYALEQGRLSNSDMMRRFAPMGFQKAGRYIDMLENAGVIGARNGNKPRDVLIGSIDEFDEIVANNL
jgi:S-DNA-T family DNA segregation ATPase FtsK/SpoIIIE